MMYGIIILKLYLCYLIVCDGDVERNPGPACPECGQSVIAGLRDTITCSICKYSLHKKCTCLADDDFKVLSKPDMIWLCSGCKPNIDVLSSLKTMSGKMDDISNSLFGIEKRLLSHDTLFIEQDDRFKVLTNNLEGLESRIGKIEKEMKEKNNSQQRNDECSVKEVDIKTEIQRQLIESNNIHSRECNLVLLHMKDNVLDEDELLIKDILVLTLNLCDFSNIRFRRIGDFNDGYNRPIILSLPSVSVKWRLYGKRFVLKTAIQKGLNDVIVIPDRTIQQRQNARLLRTELLHRKNNGEDVIIYKEKIIYRKELMHVLKNYKAVSQNVGNMECDGRSGVSIVSESVAKIAAISDPIEPLIQDSNL